MLSLTSPHLTNTNSVSRIMLTLLAALVPGIVCLILFFGWGYFINLLIASATAIATEAAILAIRKRPVWFFIKDGSALVTAALLACALPPLVPWWLTVLATATALIFGKHLFGGLGQNPFNPAMVAYALMLVSLPVLMTTRWASVENPSSLLDSLRIIFGLTEASVDAFTGATPLDYYKLNIARLTQETVLAEPIFGHWAATGWTPINLAFLIGGLALIVTRVITWHIPVSLLFGMGLMSFLFASDADAFVPVNLHMLAGSTMLTAFFIATDPASTATSNRGKLIFGFGVGVLMFTIRTWGNYPDAAAFAVLLMNLCAPFIDHYTRPRVYGHDHSTRGYKRD